MTTPKTHLQERPPIIVVMGHVDHGKSSLLDYIRKENTIAGEAGGITQHVAAYEVEHESKEHGKKRITFIDTPGHAAFSAIRARGANLADIAILVVSAEEGVKEQTVEAIKHIKESGIPHVVAINKIDRPDADIERTKVSLLEHEVLVEGYGGDIPWVAVSAKTGEGIPDLLDTLLLVAALEEYTGDAAKPAEGFVLESHRDPKRGIAASLVITDGSLKSGMALLAGQSLAPLRIMENQDGKALREAQFSTPLLVVGFDALPEVGAPFTTYKNKKEAEAARTALKEQHGNAPAASVFATEEGVFVLPVIVKADAAGSLEAIVSQIANIKTEKTCVQVVSQGIGPVGEADIKAAVASSARILAFNVHTDPAAVEMARQQEVTIEQFDIIYRLTEYVEKTLATSRPKERVEEILGKGRVIKSFSRNKNIEVFGGSVIEGQLRTGKQIRVTRRGIEVGVGFLVNLQTNKQNVEKVEEGSEFGAQLESSFELATGDTLTCFEVVEK